MLQHILLYIVSFIGIWIGAGLAISSVEKLSHRLRLSSFIVSFLVLGFFTSISEFSVGINAVLDNDPEIFVGNLIGASIVLFMLVIPLLAITGKQIRITKELQGINLVLPLVVVAVPVLLSLDGAVNRIDAIISLGLYGVSAFIIEQKRGFTSNPKLIKQVAKLSVGIEFMKILAGIAVIFASSHLVVSETLYFSGVLGFSPFLISLLLVAIGTNLPELSFIVRSLFMKSNQVAFGDYLGSAAFNTFLYGFLTIFYGRTILLTNSYVVSLTFLIVGLMLFYIFARSKHTISRSEAAGLFAIYVLFLFTEYYLHKG